MQSLEISLHIKETEQCFFPDKPILFAIISNVAVLIELAFVFLIHPVG